LVELHTITFTSSYDGSQVAALEAIPRGVCSRGCVIWQFGFGSQKEDSSQAWRRLASLGLSTFSIDLRHHGARSSGTAELERVSRSPTLYAEVIRGTVADLRSAIDYLQQQPYCRRNVAVAGVSLGGVIGAILAAIDERIKAAVIMSTPGRWREVLTQSAIPLFQGSAPDPEQLAAAQRILSPLDPARFIGQISPRAVLILNGREDEIVPLSTARALQAAAREPKTVVEYGGGHDPFSGPAGVSNAQAVASFLFRNLVEPT
jgi:pimeloyl-ACP methyl ester carboxylesterase